MLLFDFPQFVLPHLITFMGLVCNFSHCHSSNMTLSSHTNIICLARLRGHCSNAASKTGLLCVCAKEQDNVIIHKDLHHEADC